MELLFLLLLIILSSAILYLIKERRDEHNRVLSIITHGDQSITKSNPPPKKEDYWNKRKQDDSGLVTSMSKTQIEEFLKSKEKPEDSMRMALINPEDVIYLDDHHWFDPKQCDVFPSKTLIGDEIYITPKGTWIKKEHKGAKQDKFSIIDAVEAYIFLEQNGYKEMAAMYAPADPRNEI